MSSHILAKQSTDALFQLPCSCQNLRRLSRVRNQHLRSGIATGRFWGHPFRPTHRSGNRRRSQI